MVNYQVDVLNRTFAALADPTRRALLARLGETDSLSVSELARPFTVSLPAVMKHLDVLSDAGLITRSKTGRSVACRLTAGPMEEATRWLHRYQKFWSERLDNLAAFLEEDTSTRTPSARPPNRASPSGAASTPRRRKSSAPGRTRRK
jgi:DNA-binding transcriptional ArsR family regulator